MSIVPGGDLHRKLANKLADRRVCARPLKGLLRFAQKITSAGAIAREFDRPTFWPIGQVSAASARHAVIVTGLIAAVLSATDCRRDQTPGRPAASVIRPGRGGAAVASIRTEPRSFNRLAARDTSTELVTALTQARLVRINKVTQELEPWLAESWTVDSSGRQFTLTLRDHVVFSDGLPFTADDVLFTFEAIYDKQSPNALTDVMKIRGQPLTVKAPNPHTVTITFPSAYAPGLRFVADAPILPKHKLERARANGTLAAAWNLSTPIAELAGLGPFVLLEYLPGQRLVFGRNRNYWRMDENGVPLPYLDRLTVEIVPDQNAELLRLEAGQIDTTYSEVAPESYAAIKRASDAGRVKLFDLGVALVADSFWINLKPGAFASDPRAAWIQRDEFRRALSMAVDRRQFADTVFFGAGEPVDGPVTASNRKWYSPDVARTAYDPDGARRLLASIGLADRNEDGALEDAAGREVRFTVVTQKGRPKLERGMAVLRDQLKKIGIAMDVVALDGGAVVERIMSGKYEATYFNPQTTDTDPGGNTDFWFSSGSAHLWNMGQMQPATEWEKRIDDLMSKQISTTDEAERRRLFTDVMRTFAEHQPVLYFAAPRMYVAVSSRLLLTPALDPLPSLWSPDTLAVVH
jgi:peptide/nickel transport system substrate-binding protein